MAQIAKKFGIGLERARILLEILRLRSKVKREAVQRTEGPGRPTFQYQITKPGREQLNRLNQKKVRHVITEEKKRGS